MENGFRMSKLTGNKKMNEFKSKKKRIGRWRVWKTELKLLSMHW